MPVVSVRAPAKVNLFLEVVRRRPDGYHDILTVFLKIGLYDTLYLQRVASGITVVCDHPDVPADERNIVWQAAQRLQQEIGTTQGVRIRITKRIPVGAGLGGGSSDAAALLRHLPRLWGAKIPETTLVRLAAGLGADVPFFLLPETAAVGRGRGDVLQPIDVRGHIWLVVVDPGIFVSTREVYQGLGECLTKRRNDVRILIRALKDADAAGLSPYLFNRLEQVVFERHPQVRTLKETLAARGARAVLMSGSGSIVFGVAADRSEAVRMASGFRGIAAAHAVRSL